MGSSALEQDHHRHGGDRLGHGKDAEDRVGGERLACREVLQADGRAVNDPAVTGDEGDRAGQLALGDLAFEEAVDLREAGEGQALGLRFAFRQD
jgi:hypothetical protein